MVFTLLQSLYVWFPFSHSHSHPYSPNPHPDSMHFPHSQTDSAHFHPYSWHSKSDCLHSYPIPTILFIPFPDSPFRRSHMTAENETLTSLKTLLTSWKSSHQRVSQRKQFFRLAVLQSIKLRGFSIIPQMSKKEFNISSLVGLQPVILQEIELSHRYFSVIFKVQCWIVLLEILFSGSCHNRNINTCLNMTIHWF